MSPRLLVGAQSPVGIDRAARVGDGVITLSNDHCQVYLDALERHGRDVADGRIYASQWTIIAEDPEQAWAHYWAQFPGESIDSGSERIQYMADKVIPAVTQRLATRVEPAAVAVG